MKYQELKKLTLSYIITGSLQDFHPFCEKCKISDLRVLTINHDNYDGAKRRRYGEGTGVTLYKRILRKEITSDDLSVLCFNCNHLHRLEQPKKEDFYQ